MQEMVELRNQQLKQARASARTFFRRHPWFLLVVMLANYAASAFYFFQFEKLSYGRSLLAALVFVSVWIGLFLLIPNLIMILLIAVAVGATIAIATALVPSLTLIWSVIAAVGIMVVIVLIVLALLRAAKLIPGLVLGALVFFHLLSVVPVWWQAAAAGLGAFAIVALLSVYLLKYMMPAAMALFLAVFSAGFAEKLVRALLGNYTWDNLVPQIPRLSGSIGDKLNSAAALVGEVGRELLPDGLLLWWVTIVGLFLAVISIYDKIKDR